MKCAQFSFVVLAVCFHKISAYVTVKPEFIKTCRMSDPDFASCNKQTVQGIFTFLKDGIPDLKIVPLDPLNVTSIRLLQGDGPVSINATLDNVRIYGFSKTVVKSNKVMLPREPMECKMECDRGIVNINDPTSLCNRVFPDKGYSFLTKIKIPHLRIEGDYNLRGRILLLPLVGKGDCWFEPRNMEAEVRHDIKISRVDGINFFNLTNIRVNYEIEGLKLRLNKLFDGLRTLEDSTNAYLNANWKPASDSLKPILQKTIGDILIVILRQLFEQVPAEFFIEDVKNYKFNSSSQS